VLILFVEYLNSIIGLLVSIGVFFSISIFVSGVGIGLFSCFNVFLVVIEPDVCFFPQNDLLKNFKIPVRSKKRILQWWYVWDQIGR